MTNVSSDSSWTDLVDWGQDGPPAELDHPELGRLRYQATGMEADHTDVVTVVGGRRAGFVRRHLTSVVISASLLIVGGAAGAFVLTSNTAPLPKTASAAASPQQLVAMAAAQLESASSVEVNSSIPTPDGTGYVDGHIEVFANGSASGTSSTDVGSQVMALTFVYVGGIYYVRAPSFFWIYGAHLSQSTAATIGGNWVETPPGGALRLGVGSLAGVASTITALESEGKLTEGRRSVAYGKPAIAVTASNGMTLWVDASGSPRPLALTLRESGVPTTITFANWNGAVPPQSPAHALQFSSLAG